MKDGQSVIGVNAHLPYIRDRVGFYDRMRRLNPAMIVGFIDGDKYGHLVTELQRELPDTLVVARMYHQMDGGFHMRRHDGAEWVSSPADTLNWLGAYGRGGLVCSLLNEPGTSGDVPRLVKWLTEVMAIANARGIVTCVANFSTGTPAIQNGEWDSAFDLLLKSLQDGKHYLGLHEYLPGETYRVGRLLMALKRCATLGYKMPKVLITEYGVDTDGGRESGYKSRNWSGDTYAKTLCETAASVYMPLAQAGILHGAAVFSYGNSGGWHDFDVEPDGAFWETLLKNAPRYKAPKPVDVLPPIRTKADVMRTLIANIEIQLSELKNLVGE